MKTEISLQEYQEVAFLGFEATQDNRGGVVFQGYFYYPAATNVGIFKVPAKDWVATIQDTPEEIAAHHASFNREG